MKYPMMTPPASNKEKFEEYEYLHTDGTWRLGYLNFDVDFDDAVELPRSPDDEYRYFLGWADGYVRLKRVKKVRQ